MRTSIIVAAHNEGTLLAQTLQSIYETIGDLECEIIVIDDGSTDQSVEIADAARPVVPQTAWMPAVASQERFANADSATVKSIATSTPAA